MLTLCLWLPYLHRTDYLLANCQFYGRDESLVRKNANMADNHHHRNTLNHRYNLEDILCKIYCISNRHQWSPITNNILVKRDKEPLIVKDDDSIEVIATPQQHSYLIDRLQRPRDDKPQPQTAWKAIAGYESIEFEYKFLISSKNLYLYSFDSLYRIT